MTNDELMAKMQVRVDQCRRLARSITDQAASEALKQMADEGEADIARLKAEIEKPEPRSPSMGEQVGGSEGAPNAA